MNDAERELALAPGTQHVEALLARLAHSPSRPAQDWRQIASLLAGGQDPAVLLDLLDRHGRRAEFAELAACLVQELVLHGARLGGVSAVVDHLRRLRPHPLGKLPLRLTDIEGEVPSYLPHYGPRGSSSRSLPFGPGAVSAAVAPEVGGVPMLSTEVVDAGVASRIGAAVRNWQEESNDQVEARVFRVESSLTAAGLSVPFLRSLGLRCLQGAGDRDIRAELVPPRRIMNLLFAAASGGGAYN